MDVKSAFLNGYLNEEVYVAQPNGFIDLVYPQYVCKFNKALYGLMQAPRAWYERVTIYLSHKGYFRGGAYKTLFINKSKIDMIVAQIYVDDIIFGGFPKKLFNNFIDIMQSEFEMSIIGELSCFLGIFISHKKYAKNIVKKFELDKSQQKRTPAVTHVKITKDSDGDIVDNKLYRSMIGSLLYLTTSRRDVAYIVGVCARIQSNPRVSHLVAIKRIIKYVNGTSDFGVLYFYNMNSILVDYYDADWAGCLEVRKSTSKGCFFLGNNMIFWFNKKKICVSLSTTEAKYIAVGSGCTQLMWMK
ncbi:hypothetical protein IC582_000947 [Cucumis melo]